MDSNLYLQSTVVKGYLGSMNLFRTEQKSQKATHGVLETEDNSPYGLGQADEECLKSGSRLQITCTLQT